MEDKITRHDFTFNTSDPNGYPGPWTMTSVVMDLEGYNAFLDWVKEQPVKSQSGRVLSSDDVERLRESRHIPLIARGRMTEFVFRYLGVSSDYVSVIVRGEGMNVAARLMSASGAIGQA